jgi:hypothetical protein
MSSNLKRLFINPFQLYLITLRNMEMATFIAMKETTQTAKIVGLFIARLKPGLLRVEKVLLRGEGTLSRLRSVPTIPSILRYFRVY